MKTLRSLARVVFSIALFLAILFVPAGTLAWTEAWIFIAVYFIFVGWAVLGWRRHAPALLRERMNHKKKVTGWDRILMGIYTILLVPYMVLPGLDAVRFHWSAVPLAVKIAAFALSLPLLGVILWVARVNRFLSDGVRIQSERGHEVCTSGPYRYVRHPMYAAILWLMPILPLALGSFYTLIPSLLIDLIFIVRTALEDRMLRKELAGYEEYAQRVRYRLLPGIW